MIEEAEAMIERLEVWAIPVSQGYEVPAASISMHEAAALIRHLVDGLKWRGIESAPRDGTWILVTVGEPCIPGVARWHNDGENEGWQEQQDEAPCSPKEWPVTHWLPLPTPPGGEG